MHIMPIINKMCTYLSKRRVIKGKVHPRTGHDGPEGEQRQSSTLSLSSALVGGWVVNATPRPLYPRKRDPIPSVQEVGWASQSRSGRVGKISPPRPGFDPRTVQPVASFYTDCDIPANLLDTTCLIQLARYNSFNPKLRSVTENCLRKRENDPKT